MIDGIAVVWSHSPRTREGPSPTHLSLLPSSENPASSIPKSNTTHSEQMPLLEIAAPL